MKTDNFFNAFVSRETAKFDQQDSVTNKIAHWIHKHPTVVKTAEAVVGVLGVASIVSLPISLPVLGTGAVLTAIGGGIFGLISLAAYKVLDILAPPDHDMLHHTFKPASYGVGRLYYQGDVPILELQSDNAREAGMAHGYLMGEYIDRILKRLDVARMIAPEELPRAQNVPKVVEELMRRIPAIYLEEMQGLVEGFNQWVKEKKGLKAKTMTLEDLLLFHLMPDSEHFSAVQVEKGNKNPTLEPKRLAGVACTVVIDQDAKEGMVFGRTMDWYSFGMFGSYSVMINRKYANKKLSTIEVGLPALVGTVTGMNHHGLSLAMNVCTGATDKIKGMPAVFFNRMCLENCQKVEDVVERAKQTQLLGNYHLSVADQVSAQSLHLYQGEDNRHVIRKWQKGAPLITTNCKYQEDGQYSSHLMCSQERHLIVNNLFKEAVASVPPESLEKGKLVTGSLALPYVNNLLTTHKVVMYPQLKKIKVAFDNAFGGDSNLHEMNTSTLLAHP